MATRRARLGSGHALAWVAHGLAAAALVTDALGRERAPLALAFGAACALAAAALAIAVLGAVSARAGTAPRALLLAAATVAAIAAAGAAALALLDQPPHLAVAAALGLAAGVQIAGVRAQVAADPVLAPRVRPAPTLLAAAAGVALVAVAAASSALGVSIALIAAALLQLVIAALATASNPPSDRVDGPVPDQGTRHNRSSDLEGVRAAETAQPALLALLAIAAAGLTALAALRPALSAIGADHPQPAGPIALTLALGALLGPPLAMLAERAGGRSAAVLATVGGAAALAAPIARPGVLDWVAAVVLGVALAASVALAELARRAGHRVATGATALLLLAGAAGASLAALLLHAVPLPDVVLGAALACLVAAVGVWAPSAAREPVG
ncbi:hypothetical protein SAMN04487783_1051 [Agrococcus baldri]|uniref:Uncharacterized protein n=1 Tax=Agrococcus baldri TaxID=153730 RepID=A0AA94KZ70_9MICO|nr:hypothetical protein [Agrococcus baldri]SFS08110.1 hypothetical protein SAMN04487783_1051 [Agrococcus baldri]